MLGMYDVCCNTYHAYMQYSTGIKHTPFRKIIITTYDVMYKI